VAQVVMHLPTKCEAPSSSPGTAKKKEEARRWLNRTGLGGRENPPPYTYTSIAVFVVTVPFVPHHNP
jgi:hypothetical protein